MYPPVKTHLIVYISIFVSISLLSCVGFWLIAWEQQSIVIVTYLGVCIGFIYVITMNWWRWKTSSTQQALLALQALRTNEIYLRSASIIRDKIGNDRTPLSQNAIDEILDKRASLDLQNPSFSDATYFVLNQYEFIAAAARLGAMDTELLENTVSSAVKHIAYIFAPLISKIRKQQPSAYENLVWLYREFTDDWKTDFGDFDQIPDWLKAK